MPSPTEPFKDVPSNHWAVDAIKYEKEEKLMVGNPDGTFAPNVCYKSTVSAGAI